MFSFRHTKQTSKNVANTTFKMFFHHITAILLSLIIQLIKLQTASLPKYVLNDLLNLSPTHTNL